MNKIEIRTTTIRFPIDLFKKVENEAANLNITANSMLKIIVSQYFNKK